MEQDEINSAKWWRGRKEKQKANLIPTEFKKQGYSPARAERTWSPWCGPCHAAGEEEGLGFSRPSQQRFSFSFYHSSLHLLKNDFTLFLGKKGVPGGNSKA